MPGKKSGLVSLFHRSPPAASEPAASVTQENIDHLAHELATYELDARFRHSLATGEITGDIVEVDEQGREIKTPRKRSNILGL